MYTWFSLQTNVLYLFYIFEPAHLRHSYIFGHKKKSTGFLSSLYNSLWFLTSPRMTLDRPQCAWTWLNISLWICPAYRVSNSEVFYEVFLAQKKMYCNYNICISWRKCMWLLQLLLAGPAAINLANSDADHGKQVELPSCLLGSYLCFCSPFYTVI